MIEFVVRVAEIKVLRKERGSWAAKPIFSATDLK